MGGVRLSVGREVMVAPAAGQRQRLDSKGTEATYYRRGRRAELQGHGANDMATMNYKMKVALDIVEAKFQRNKSDPDQDIATLWVTTTNNLDSKFVAGPAAIGALGSGQMVTLDPTLVETQEFVVNDDDQIVIMPFINNQSYVPPDQAISQALKIAGGVLACVACGEALAGFMLQAAVPPGSTSEFANFVTKD